MIHEKQFADEASDACLFIQTLENKLSRLGLL